jgi:Mg-chelatase subunit ChlI
MSETVNIRDLNEIVASNHNFVDLIVKGMDQTIVGQKHLIDSLLIALLSNGHILLEGVPGLAKTLAIKTLSQLIDAKYSRIQFTPDLLPADVIGTMVYSVQKEQFQVKRGPIFANFVLADEINRAPAKVQSALLEAMQEHQVTIGDSTFGLDDPFLVMATQNPIEQEGTYPLPEAQVDRFLLKVVIGYPSREEEKVIIRQNISNEKTKIVPLVRPEEILQAQKNRRANLYRRKNRKIYRRHRVRHPLPQRCRSQRFGNNHSLRSLASCLNLIGQSSSRLCVLESPRLRDSRRRACSMPRRDAPSYRSDLRSRSQQHHCRRDYHQYSRQSRGALIG